MGLIPRREADELVAGVDELLAPGPVTPQTIQDSGALEDRLGSSQHLGGEFDAVALLQRLGAAIPARVFGEPALRVFALYGLGQVIQAGGLDGASVVLAAALWLALQQQRSPPARPPAEISTTTLAPAGQVLLFSFLRDRFTGEELHMFVHFLGPQGEEAARDLPRPRALGRADYAFEVLLALDRRGLVDEELLRQLGRARPRHAAQLAQIAAMLQPPA